MTTTARLRIAVEDTPAGEMMVLSISGNLDSAGTAVLRRLLDSLEDDAPLPVIVDLDGVRLIGPTAVSVLASARRRFAAKDRSLVLARPRRPLEVVLERTGLIARLTLEDI